MILSINRTFDEQFKNLRLNQLPWVGKDYNNLPSKQKLLLVPESRYDWQEENVREDNLNDPEYQRGWIQNTDIPAKILSNIERALFKVRDPTKEQKDHLWNSVAYHDIVQRVLKEGDELIDSDFEEGWNTLFEVFEILRPDYILFCGLRASNNDYFKQAFQKNGFKTTDILELEKIGNTYPRTATVTNDDGDNVKLVFMKHPSKYFSWGKWAEFLDKADVMNDYTKLLQRQ